MWRLSKLDIRGFKSFAEPSELIFPEGITAVVGPNGCGKSNISDAIVWALGEQSTNVLRAQRMNDVIFQGSASRRPTPVAEVTLHLTTREADGLDIHHEIVQVLDDGVPPTTETIETSESADEGSTDPGTVGGNGAAVEAAGGNGTAPLADSDPDAGAAPHFVPGEGAADEQELKITRRLFRSGDSEYLINGEKRLLREVREQLLGTGLGTRACFTIEQGRIDQILSASPLERRGPIEEAAGISLYRRRRHGTNLKLEATEQDLSRVEDIVGEVARQMRSLKRQAGRAKRYRKLRDRLNVLERHWFSYRWQESRRTIDVAAAALQAAVLAEQTLREELEATTRRWESARRRWRDQRAKETERRQALYGRQVAQERDKAEAARQRDRAAFAQQRLRELELRIEEARSQIEEARGLAESRRDAAAQAAAVVEAAESVQQEARDRLDPVVELESRRAAETEGERTLELRPLAAHVSVSDEDRGAVALALGGTLRAAVLTEDGLVPWLETMRDEGAAARALRDPGMTVTPPPAPDDRILGPLVDRVRAKEDLAPVVGDLLYRTWLVETPELALELSSLHPADAFVDRAGTTWARGAEIRIRNADGAQRMLSASAGPTLRLRFEKSAESTEETSETGQVELQAARLAVERAEAAYRSARAQALAARKEAEVAEAGCRRIEEKIERMAAETQALTATAEDAAKKADAAEAGAADASRQCDALEAELREDTAVDVADEAEIAALEVAIAEQRRRVERAQSARAGSEVEVAEHRVARRHLQAQIRERLHMEPAALLAEMEDERAEAADADGAADVDGAADASEAADVDEARDDIAGRAALAVSADPDVPGPAELPGEIEEVRAAIDKLGPVNLVAYEDFQEQEARFHELDGQRKDLVDAAGNLRDAIRLIDRDCVERFTEAFEAIDGYFNRIFRQLFGGGRAGMRLETPEEPLNSGIEIVAQPPGKTLQSIRLMSGGERSLIALALMFAIFEYHPSPFCILDEADAALDDRNVGRFVQALHHFQDRAQFIMITHNKRSMEVADLLYGVTMEESGVSKLVSVRLN